MNPIYELNNIFKRIHNLNSTAEQEFEEEEQKETWFDKLVLRWF